MNSRQQNRDERMTKARGILRHPTFVSATKAKQGAILKMLRDGGLADADLIELQMEALDAPEINFRTTIAELGKDPLFLVMKNLDARSVLRLCSTDKRFSAFCKKNNNAIWMYMINRDYPDLKQPFTPYLKWLFQYKSAQEYYKYISQPSKLVAMSPKVYEQITRQKFGTLFNNNDAQIEHDANRDLAPRLNVVYPPIFPGDTIWMSPGNKRLSWDGKKFTTITVNEVPQNILQMQHARLQEDVDQVSSGTAGMGSVGKPDGEFSETRVAHARAILRHPTFATQSANIQRSILNALVSKGLTADELTAARAL